MNTGKTIILAAPKTCGRVAIGIMSGAFGAMGIPLVTVEAVDQAQDLADLTAFCKDKLPSSIGSTSDAVATVMKEGGRDSLMKAKAILSNAGEDAHCISVFGAVCAAARKFNAPQFLKQACLNLWFE